MSALGATVSALASVDEPGNFPEKGATALKGVADNLQGQMFDIFGQIVPYAIGVIGLAWGWRTLKRNLGANSAKV